MSRMVGAMAGIVRCAFEGDTPEGAFSNGDVFAAACNGEALFKVDGGGAFFVDVRHSPHDVIFYADGAGMSLLADLFSDAETWPAGHEEALLAR